MSIADWFRRKSEGERVDVLEKKLVKRDGNRVLLVAKAIHAGQRAKGLWWDELAPLTRAERKYVYEKLREWRR